MITIITIIRADPGRLYRPAWSSRPRLVARAAEVGGKVGLCVYVCIRVCVCIYIYIYVHTHLHTYIHTCMHTCMHARTHACMHTCMHTYICIYFVYMFCFYHVSCCLSLFRRQGRPSRCRRACRCGVDGRHAAPPLPRGARRRRGDCVELLLQAGADLELGERCIIMSFAVVMLRLYIV